MNALAKQGARVPLYNRKGDCGAGEAHTQSNQARGCACMSTDRGLPGVHHWARSGVSD
jgi:hypothetical protein